MTSIKKITNSFDKLGYTKRSKITQNQFYQILNDLYGQPFDNAVAQQLWQQAAVNSKQEAQISELIEIINKAQKILNQKTIQISETIYNLQRRKQQIEQDTNLRPQQKSVQLKALNQQILQLKKDKQQFQEDLHLVTAPFGIVQNQPTNINSKHVSTKYAGRDEQYSVAESERDKNRDIMQNVKQIGQNSELKYTLWITLFIGLFQLILIYSKYDYLNLIVVVTVSSIFLLNYFDSFYIKICLILTSVSVVLDFVWLLLYASKYWNPPLVGVHSQNQVGFLRFIVFFTVVIIAAKLLIIYFLFGFRNLSSESNYSVSLIGKAKITLSANKPSLITASLGKNIN